MKSSAIVWYGSLVTALAASPGYAPAEQPAYEVGENVLVGRQPAGEVLIEPHLATHPSDPNTLLAVGWVHLAGDAAPAEEHCATSIHRMDVTGRAGTWRASGAAIRGFPSRARGSPC